MTDCTNCGDHIEGNTARCPNCGASQETPLVTDGGERAADEKYCTECGELIKEDAEICPECGVRQQSSGETSSDQVVAGVLAIVVGFVGAHKFYQGNIKYGVLYLCFFWTGIPALLGLVEGILMLVADEAEYEEKYADGSIFGEF
ncbi:TM2 domain-containing protein [Halostagnicola kamekurae]|uniref:Double zinc ribbon n=1 Tax=Halostagnicola kamekurae TaxID=619731 RepID=A0A1I6PQM9_9EURY|nr:TM2 domain-containing protein [Halostagnicola kamekurae]SFS42532.1 Double zinc ribbon [Halostagnicola kamekurae]